MGRFRNTVTGVVVNVDDAKDGRFGDGWESASADAAPAKKAAAKKPSPSKSDK